MVRTPSIYHEIKSDLKEISRALVADESEHMERCWYDIKVQIIDLASRARNEHIAKKRGYLVVPGNTIATWECIDCHAFGQPAGSKKCRDCGRKFHPPRATE